MDKRLIVRRFVIGVYRIVDTRTDLMFAYHYASRGEAGQMRQYIVNVSQYRHVLGCFVADYWETIPAKGESW